DTSSDTNGAVVVYASTRNGEQDVYWQPVDGGPEGHVQLAGPDVEPNISGRLITFVHLDTSGPITQTDIYGFDIVTGTLYRFTNTPGSEDLDDVSVDASGHGRVVWSVLEQGGQNVYTSSFTLGGYGVCVHYDEGASHRAGSTIPIKLGLCDAAGANVS